MILLGGQLKVDEPFYYIAYLLIMNFCCCSFLCSFWNFVILKSWNLTHECQFIGISYFTSTLALFNWNVLSSTTIFILSNLPDIKLNVLSRDVHIIINQFFHLFLILDLVLQNRLVLYDLENQTIGWTEYNCELFSITKISYTLDSYFPCLISSCWTNLHACDAYSSSLIVGWRFLDLFYLV